MGLKERFYVDIMAVHPEVTGSCNLVIVKYPDKTTSRFIVDCGMFQERDYAEYNKSFPFEAENIEFCIVTHNHVDHTGRLPLLVKKGFRGTIFLTKPTKMLIPLVLEDSYKVVRELAKRNHVPELYSDGNVAETLGHTKALNYDVTEFVNKNIKVTMFKNGHIVGAAVVLVQISYPGFDDINILFTGDYNKKNMFFDVDELPEWVLNLPLIVVQESTYGTTVSGDVENNSSSFKENILHCMKNDGTAVNMAFSLGRFQEVLYTIKCMQKEKELSSDIPIYADGKLGIRYTNLFQKDELGIREEMKEFLPENLNWVNKENREQVLMSTDKKIIVTTSGMGTYGPAPMYIHNYIKYRNSLIQFTGYTAEGTLGERLKSAKMGETVNTAGVLSIKQARVEYSIEFSAHAKADDMIDFLKKFKNLKLVLINHGTTHVKDEFAKKVVQEVKPKDVGVLGREYFYRVGHYGLIRTMSTKFE